MSKKAPSTTQLLVITGFAFSCFGILLFMWVTFGGPTPFKAKPYEIKIPFTEATQLAQQSDVRISGVSIGKVQSIDVAPDGQEALATVDIDDKYGPIPQNTRAILRTKTLLGGDLHRTHPRQQLRTRARGRRHAPRSERRPVGPARRDLPHLRSPHPRRLPGMDAELGDRDRGQRPEPLRSLRPVRPDPDRIRPAVPRARHAAAGGPGPVPQRRHRAAGLPRPQRPARRPDPELERGLPDDGGARTGHRSAVQGLPDLPRRVPDHPRPPPRLLGQHRPADAPAGAGCRRALADPDRDRQTLARSGRLLQGAAAGHRRVLDRVPGAAEAVPRPVPAAAARGRPVPAQPQPGHHQPRPVQARARGLDGERRRRHQRRSTSARTKSRSTTCA